jgi:hypothetical protein
LVFELDTPNDGALTCLSQVSGTLLFTIRSVSGATDPARRVSGLVVVLGALTCVTQVSGTR